MRVCTGCGGYIEELGELPDYENPCTCKTNNLQKRISELEQRHKQDMITLGDYALEIDRLRQQKAELLKFIRKVYKEQWINNREFMGILKKYEVKE